MRLSVLMYVNKVNQKSCKIIIQSDTQLLMNHYLPTFYTIITVTSQGLDIGLAVDNSNAIDLFY